MLIRNFRPKIDSNHQVLVRSRLKSRIAWTKLAFSAFRKEFVNKFQLFKKESALMLKFKILKAMMLVAILGLLA